MNECKRIDARATVSYALCWTLLSAAGCVQSHDTLADVDSTELELAGLMADGELPTAMAPPPAEPAPAPPRFCPAPPSPGGDTDGGVAEPSRRLPPVVVVGDGATGAAGAGAAGGGPVEPDPLCAAIPIAFWNFDDCDPSRTDLFDSSFQSHTAFRTVDVACTPGRERQAVSFARPEDLVYAPDQPDYALDHGVTIAAWVRPDTVDDVHTLFRKRDGADSAFALLINRGRFQFVVRLDSGRIASASAPAAAGAWTHVAGSFDGKVVRLYVDGAEVSRTPARGELSRGAGPLLMGNDAAERRFAGVMDGVWFNTMAAPSSTILALTCLRHDPTLNVSPEVSPSVPAGTAVTYTLAIHNPNHADCAPESFATFVTPELFDFVIEPSFVQVDAVESGETRELEFAVQSGAQTEGGSYRLVFQAQSSDGNFFGPVGVFGPLPRPVSPTSARSQTAFADEPAVEPPVLRTGLVEASAQYVVQEAEGCHVSSQRELMVRDVSVVDDPVRTSFEGPAGDAKRGAWSFGRLMQRLSPTDADAADNTEAMFRSFLSPQTINGFTVGPRPPMEDLVLRTWPRTADGKLDLARAPVRLLAITNRLDLVDLAKGKAGEGRITFGVLSPEGLPMEFTVIFEYALQATDEAEVQAWADAVHALQALSFPSEAYNEALQVLTDRFSGRSDREGLPNGSGLIDIRTNELALNDDGQWQMREFRISPETGSIAPANVALTPDASFNFESEVLARFINANEATILTETHEVPARFEDMPFLGGAVFNNIDFWTAPGITNPEARHKFSLNTCNGCHGAETQTGFLHISPREAGRPSVLSGFLTGTTVFDPMTGEERPLNELARRRGLLEQVVCAPEP